MAAINQLPLLNSASSGDQIPVYSPNNGDARRLSVSSLLAYFQQNFASPTMAVNLYVPSTGFSIPVPTPVSEQQWILLQPAGTLASGSITLPLNTSTADGAEVLVTTTQAITSFSFSLNGATAVTGDTGSGALVFATSHTLVTPVLGVATGTSLATSGSQLVNGTGKQGYDTGAGGTVTQGAGSGKATSVTLNKQCGSITMDGAALAANTTVSFTLTNSTIEAGDILILNHISGGTAGAYTFNPQCGAGSASISVRNGTAGSLSEAIVIRFAVMKVVSA
jgi:hypothetical protein